MEWARHKGEPGATGAMAVSASMPSIEAAWLDVSPPEMIARVSLASRTTASSTRPRPEPIRSFTLSAETPAAATACRMAATAGSSGPVAVNASGLRPSESTRRASLVTRPISFSQAGSSTALAASMRMPEKPWPSAWAIWLAVTGETEPDTPAI